MIKKNQRKSPVSSKLVLRSCRDHLRRVYTRGRFSGVAPVRYGATVGRLAGSGLRAVPGRDHDYMVPEIEPEVVENMRSWEHSGFSVDFRLRRGNIPAACG